MDNPICPKCQLPVLANFYFCPNCGKNLRPKPLSISIGKQIGIYLLSFFLPPLGLVPGIKYLLQKSGKAKVVGFVAIILTVVSIIITINLTLGLVNQLRNQLNSQLNDQLNNQIQNTQLQFNQTPSATN